MQATPHSPDMGTTSFLQISSQKVTILVQTYWKDEVGDVSAVPLQLQECARKTKVFQAIKCTQSLLLLCGIISFIPMRGATVCWETSANAVPTLPRAMLAIISPKLGLRSWVMSKGSNLHCTSFSTSAQPLHHPSTSFYFPMPQSLMAKGTNALSHLRKETKEVVMTVGKS